ncbi:hypothetical protein PVAP13_9NG753508 [Panicum virgatum]|uniref:Uncharacterized protein n=1 Tax=Panicum virgatum TaxID=38727 RepID=A0A8T0N413_PANVG|nr:hypothetical protein PVAP13_9NG753508 [Panicum virgatum]
MPPVPVRWTGVFQGGERFNISNCNRKLIGARFYSKGHRANYPTNPSEAVSLLEYRVRVAAGHARPRHAHSVHGGGRGGARCQRPGRRGRGGARRGARRARRGLQGVLVQRLLQL